MTTFLPKLAVVNNRHERLNLEDPSWWNDEEEEDAVDNDNHDDDEYLGNTATNSPSAISIKKNIPCGRMNGYLTFDYHVSIRLKRGTTFPNATTL